MATPQGETPADIFQERNGEIFPLIGKRQNFTTVTSNLLAKKIITRKELKQIESEPNLNDEERGKRIADLLSDKLDEDEDQAAQCLLKICEVFESKLVNNEPLRKLGASMREKLSTVTSQTSRQGNDDKEEQTKVKEIKTPRQESEKNGDQEEPQTKDGATAGNKKSDAPKGENPPKLSDNGDKYKPSKEINFKDISTDVVESIKIVITPATLEEEEAVLRYLGPIADDKYINAFIYDRTISNIYIGKFGENPVVVATTAPPQHKQGPVHAAIVITKILEKFENIKYIVGVGVCYGMNKDKQKLGQVIVSTILCDFTNKREGKTELTNFQRSVQSNVGNSISNMFIPSDEIKSKLPECIIADKGVYICTPSLIDNDELKEEYKDTRKDAKAGEMEGAGLLAATEYTKKKVEAIVIKGIGDWGDGDKKATEIWKPFAARAAVCYVKTVLEIKTVTCDSD